jgi:hypothetical protein
MRLNQPSSRRMKTSEAKHQTTVAFESLAGRYDDLFSRSRIGTQRGVVWGVLADTFRPGDEILALNCRTREDAQFLSLLDVSVVACDAPEGMIRAVRNPLVHPDLRPADYLSKRRPGALFDGALWNFSGLNTVADLNRTARDLASMVTLGAPVIICLSTRFCLSETLWFLLHGKVRKAFRRSFGIATVKVGDCTVKIHYPALRRVRKSFSPSFLMRSCMGIGVAVPPSFLEPITRKYPRVLGLLRRIDKGVSHLPLFRAIGDHMLVYFERVEG